LVIEKLQTAIERGGLIAIAMPRGQGKSSIVERSALWSVLTAKRKFCGIVAANETLAQRSLTKIKAELERNPLLLADFPKPVYPLTRLESQARRCVGQLYEGRRTCITWRLKELVFPTMPPPNNEGSGAAILVAGISGAIRGLSYVDDSGATIRPDLVLCDDPQDRESSRSIVQTAERMSILSGDLVGLAGPGRTMTCVVPCTVINRGDLADQLLDREKSPEWDSVRCKLVYSWPDRGDLWDEYLLLRRKGMQPGGDRTAATEFYARNRLEMDRGGRVSWPERFEPGELSALQHAFNLRSKIGDASFMAEMQNEPVDHASVIDSYDPVAIASRCSGLPRFVGPVETEKLTAMIDVGGSVLWYMVCAWDELFSCHVIDYGPWPAQRSRIFVSRNASPSLEQVYPGGEEAAVFAGLTALVAHLMDREWRRFDGAALPLARIVIDEGWNTSLIRRFIRGNPHHERLVPSQGIGLTVAKAPMADWSRKAGEKKGENWLLRAASSKDRLRTLLIDANSWKSRIASMLTRPMGQ
jgi:hypothetical protein